MRMERCVRIPLRRNRRALQEVRNKLGMTVQSSLNPADKRERHSRPLLKNSVVHRPALPAAARLPWTSAGRMNSPSDWSPAHAESQHKDGCYSPPSSTGRNSHAQRPSHLNEDPTAAWACQARSFVQAQRAARCGAVPAQACFPFAAADYYPAELQVCCLDSHALDCVSCHWSWEPGKRFSHAAASGRHGPVRAPKCPRRLAACDPERLAPG
jgi:hypothetical protein